ncbi:dihydrofolate reductase family protein [Streptomyces sp. NPDC058735]|uniref:dihydrofolate reductase family protein n=1 Tax=unclassified Streptomyces TaxID=2593676 RepID=UPI00367AE472
MNDMPPQTAAGKVLWHFSMSPDGFVAGPNHAMDRVTAATDHPGLVEAYTETTGAVLGGRTGWDAFPDPGTIYGGAWQGPLFVLTHHPEDAHPTPGVTFLNCDVAEAVRIALKAAGRKNVEVFSPTIGRQLLEHGLHDVPVLLGDGIRLFLGDGIRLFDDPGGLPVPLEFRNGDDRRAAVNVRYRPTPTG